MEKPQIQEGPWPPWPPISAAYGGDIHCQIPCKSMVSYEDGVGDDVDMYIYRRLADEIQVAKSLKFSTG